MRYGQLKLVSVAALLGTGGLAATAYAGHDTRTTTATTARPTAIARTESVGGYRFVKSPIIVRLDVSGRASDVSVYFRMNRRLPKGSYATVDGQPPARRALTPFVPKNDRCYRQDAGGTMRSPWMGVPLGTSATFALHIHGVAKTLKAIAPLTAPLPIEKNANGIGNEGLAYERKLHCLRAGKARHSAGLPRAWPASPADASSKAVRGSARCTSGGARVLAGNDKVLVVRRPRGHTLACVIATGQSRSLGDTLPGEGETKITVRRFALAGSIVAFNWEYSREEVEQGVSVLDLRGHRRVRGYDAVSNIAALRPGAHSTVTSIVVRADGAVGWIARNDNVQPARFEVQRATASDVKPTLLGAGVDIEPASLAFGGTALYWLAGGLAQSSPF